MLIEDVSALKTFDLVEFTGVDPNNLNRQVVEWPVHATKPIRDRMMDGYVADVILGGVGIRECCMILENEDPFLLVLTPRGKGWIYNVEGWFDLHDNQG